jgi:hypothetical protein
MIAVCGTIRIATRRRLLNVIHNWATIYRLKLSRPASKVLNKPSNTQTRTHRKWLPTLAGLVLAAGTPAGTSGMLLSVIWRAHRGRKIGQRYF